MLLPSFKHKLITNLLLSPQRYWQVTKLSLVRHNYVTSEVTLVIRTFLRLSLFARRAPPSGGGRRLYLYQLCVEFSSARRASYASVRHSARRETCMRNMCSSLSVARAVGSIGLVALFSASPLRSVWRAVWAVGRQPGALYACATRGIDQPAPSRPHCRTFLGAEAVPRPVSVDCPRGGRVSASATAQAALRRARERRGRRTLLRADQTGSLSAADGCDVAAALAQRTRAKRVRDEEVYVQGRAGRVPQLGAGGAARDRAGDPGDPARRTLPDQKGERCRPRPRRSLRSLTLECSRLWDRRLDANPMPHSISRALCTVLCKRRSVDTAAVSGGIKTFAVSAFTIARANRFPRVMNCRYSAIH